MANKESNLKATLLAAILAACATSVAGCNADSAASNEFFPPSESSAERKIMDAQAAVGARADATLHTKHFDGAALNSLGKAKLDLMMANLPDEGPITIYIDLPKAAADTAAGTKNAADGKATAEKDSADETARMDAVKEYLTNSHLTVDQFKLVMGPNPGMSYPTATAIQNYAKTDTGSGDSGYGSSSGAASGGSSAATAK